MDICERIVDEELNLSCDQPATDTVVVRDRTGTMRVRVCAKHKAEHNKTAAQLRTRTKSR